jgi:hypothetical protein
LGKGFQLVFVNPGHFDKQELDPDPAKEAYHAFIADENLLAQLVVTDRFGRKAHNTASQLTFPKTLQAFPVQLINFAGLGNNAKSLVAGLDQVHCHCLHKPFALAFFCLPGNYIKQSGFIIILLFLPAPGNTNLRQLPRVQFFY